MVYICEKCKTSFDRLSSYKRHMVGKRTCVNLDSIATQLEKLTCPYCTKILSTVPRQKTHINICKNKPSEIEELKDIIKTMSLTLNNKIDKQANQISNLLEKTGGNNVSITNNNQQNNTFNIVPFGQEKFDYITDKEYKKIFKAGCQSMQTFIPLIYCNKNNPENMNVYIGNFNDDSVRIFNGDGWIIEKKEDVLYNMYHSKRDYLELKFEDMQESLSDNTKYFFEKFKACNEDPETIKIIQHDIKNILYANRMNVTKNPSKKKKAKTIRPEEIDDINNINFIPNEPLFKYTK